MRTFRLLQQSLSPLTRLTGEQTHVGLTRLERTSSLTHQLLPDLLQRHHLKRRSRRPAKVRWPRHQGHPFSVKSV